MNRQLPAPSDIFVKDLSIVAEEARRAKKRLAPCGGRHYKCFLAASGQGHGLADDSQVIRAYRGLKQRRPRNERTP